MGKLGQTVISTYASTNYSFVLQKGKAVGILVEGNGEKNFYTFNKDLYTPKYYFSSKILRLFLKFYISAFVFLFLFIFLFILLKKTPLY